MNFQVKPLNDIKRILLSETIKLLQHHGHLSKDYQISLQPGDKIFPNEDIFAAIRKLDTPRNAQVEFLWHALDELERISTIGFNNEKLVPHYRERCFTGIAIAVVDQIYNSYRYLRSADKNSVFYEGLQRAVGLLPEVLPEGEKTAEREENTLDQASKATLTGCAFRFLMPYLYEDSSLQYIREVTPFSHIPHLNLGTLYTTLVNINQQTYADALKLAEKNTLERTGRKELEAKQKEKAEQGPSKGYFGMRIFGNTAHTSTSNPSEATNLPPKADEHQKPATLTNP